MTNPDYDQIALQLYNICVNYDIGYVIGRAEIVAALRHAERVGFTKGVEEAESAWWRALDAQVGDK